MYLNQEGRRCRSILEAKTDAFLHWSSIGHEHEVRVGRLPYIADFRLEDGTYIEVAGMMQYPRYHKKFDKKMLDYAINGVSVIYLFAHDVNRIFFDCPVELKVLYERVCGECGKQDNDLVNLMCRPCSRKKWGKANAVESKCLRCEKSFMRPAGSPRAKYCTRECYWSSLRKQSQPTEWFIEQSKLKSISSLALENGIEPNCLYARIRRFKEKLLLKPQIL
jgi:hypothetical protein